ncbi:MAG: RraA family protein [Proteobacteria bacterium]|nr:RraA family protein [Pseudomonadota bacterium]
MGTRDTGTTRVAKLCRRLAKLYTGAVADVMDGMGHRSQALPSEIRPLDPAMKVAGPAFTVRGRAKQYQDGIDPRGRQIAMLRAIPPNSVVVVHPGDEGTAAHWGELMSNVARQQGATGAVIAGGLRDSRQILDIGFPVFRIFHSPLTAVWRWDITDHDVPVRMGGVLVRPGDYLLGDIDGVLVIPAEIVEEVVSRTEDVARRETVVRKALQRGGRIDELFARYKVL